MSNLLRPEDIVFWRWVDTSHIRTGDLVVLANRDGEICIHRSIGNGITKGDWLRTSDPRGLNRDHVLGKVISIRRGDIEVLRQCDTSVRTKATVFLSRLGERLATRFHRRLYGVVRLMLRVMWAPVYYKGTASR